MQLWTYTTVLWMVSIVHVTLAYWDAVDIQYD
jgi:hypothetical protein